MMTAFLRKLTVGFLCLFSAVALLDAAPNPTYVPYDVADAVHELDKVIDVKARKQIALNPVGMIFRDRWRLWDEDSRLSQYFLAHNAAGPYVSYIARTSVP